MEKKLAEDFKNKFHGPGGSNNQGGMGGGNNGGNMGGIGGFNPYQNLDPRQLVNNNGGNNILNPYDNNPNFTFGPTKQVVENNKPNNQPKIPANLGPNIYVPP